MEPAMKQRLLGAAVIVGLAVLILPWLLDGSGTRDIEEIPPPPQPETAQTGPIVRDDSVPLPPPERAPEPESEPGPEPGSEPESEPESEPLFEPPVIRPETESPPPEVVTPEPAVPASQPPPSPAPAPEPSVPPAPRPSASAPAKPDAAAVSWVVQVGSFSEQDKAQALRDRLRAAGYKGFVDEFTSGKGKTMYRVRVGPVPERAEADALQQRLRSEQRLDGYVTQHS